MFDSADGNARRRPSILPSSVSTCLPARENITSTPAHLHKCLRTAALTLYIKDFASSLLPEITAEFGPHARALTISLSAWKSARYCWALSSRAQVDKKKNVKTLLQCGEQYIELMSQTSLFFYFSFARFSTVKKASKLSTRLGNLTGINCVQAQQLAMWLRWSLSCFQ